MGPAKCKVCGKSEWRHICAPPSVHSLETTPAGYVLEFDSRLWVALAKPKTDRKEYLKFKARERRARQKAAKASA